VNLIVEKYLAQENQKKKEPLVAFETEMDANFSRIRSSETEFGNLLADVVKAYTDSEVAIVHAGTMRFDNTVQKGMFTYKDLNSMLPTSDTLVKLLISG
jgi:2',3'-cyclic-nucleotide 2'-phosphodiesterase (5'-nucleotidase family)